MTHARPRDSPKQAHRHLLHIDSLGMPLHDINDTDRERQQHVAN